MSCRSITQIIRQARNAGILIELEENGDLRLRAPNEPPQAMVQHLREHKRELVEFLKAKAAAEDLERRMVASRQKRISRRGAATILYLHGNGGHIGYRGDRVRPFIDAGFGVLLVEYRGYGGNPGRPSEQGLMSDARAALVFLNTAGALPAATVLYGESLGSTVAGAIAAEQAAAGQPVAALVLEAPLSSVSDVAAHHYPWMPVRWLLKDRFQAVARIAGVGAPVLIIHGEADEIVPIRHGRALFEAAGAQGSAD